MKPVNLLPQRYRSAGPSGGRSGSSYFVLGGLATVLLGVVLYAFTANQVNSREADAAEASGAADAAEAEAGALAPFGDFREVKETRVGAVTSLAEGRLDWERLARELAYVVPRGVRLESVEGSATGEAGEEGSAASSPAPSTPPSSESTAEPSDSGGSAMPAPGTEAPSPTVALTGCARSQQTVAKTVVRLRRLNGAEDVTLEDSSSAADGAASGGGSGDTAIGCPAYSFNATVHLAATGTPATGLEAKAVPARLGGGS